MVRIRTLRAPVLISRCTFSFRRSFTIIGDIGPFFFQDQCSVDFHGSEDDENSKADTVILESPPTDDPEPDLADKAMTHSCLHLSRGSSIASEEDSQAERQ